MDMRIRERRLRRASLATLLGSALLAAPFVGAGGIDNDSPFTLPAFSTGNGTNTLASSDGDGSGAAQVAALVPEVGAGSQLVFGQPKKGGLLAVLNGVQMAAPGSDASGSCGSPPLKLVVPPGQTVFVSDSAPQLGDTTVEISGRFDVVGSVATRLELGMPISGLQAFLVIGTACNGALIPQYAQTVLPVPLVDSQIDVSAIIGSLAQQPQLAGKHAAVVVLRPAYDKTGKLEVKTHGIVAFTIGVAKTRIDLAAHLID